MKSYYKVPLLVLCCFTIIAEAQTLEDNFEGNSSLVWVGDDCGVDPQYANPQINAQNSSLQVLKYDDAGGLYANVRFDIGTNLDLSSNSTFSFKIYVASSSLTGNQTNQVSLKLQDGRLPQPWVNQTEIIKPIALNQWQTVSFDFRNDAFINLQAGSLDPKDRDDLNRVLIQVNGENNTDHVVAYIDDFSYDGVLPIPEPEVDYSRLLWADEFDGNTLDTSKWHHQTLLPNGSSWYNNEVQHYTNRVENSFVSNGRLHIRAIKAPFTDQGVTKEYTSARLNSKFAFTQGKVEVRAKLPRGSGTWPAIWTLGKNIDEPGGYWQPKHGVVSWPACGEIDIMEHWGHNQNYVSSALHTPSSFGGTVNVGGIINPTASDSFHIYSMIWDEDKIRFFLDGFNFYTYEPEVQNMETWPFIADQYILLNVAMQGNIDPAFTQSDMVIDYVRVYGQAVPSGSKAKTGKESLKIYPAPASSVIKTNASPSAAYNVIDCNGRLVLSGRIRSDQTIEVSKLPLGYYTLQVEAQTTKLIIQR